MIKYLRQTAHLWWQKPAKVGERADDREISFLELFYDLAYVAIIIELTYIVAGHLSIEALLQYAALFGMVWWAWVNGSFYHEAHAKNDIRTRVFTFLQIFALVGMAIFARAAFSEEGYVGFALSYAAFLVVLAHLWRATGTVDPIHKELSRPYMHGFSATVLLFLASAFFPFEKAMYFWVAGLATSLLLPLLNMLLFRGERHAAVAAHRAVATRINPPFVERVGLLTTIMVGESIISTVGGARYITHFGIGEVLLLFSIIGMIIALWWVYFDFVARRIPVQEKIWSGTTWIYLHLPLTMSIGVTSAGIYNALAHAHDFGAVDRWFLVAPVITYLLSIVSLMSVLDIRTAYREVYIAGRRAAFFGIAVILCGGFLELSAAGTVFVILLGLILPVLAGFRIWVERIALHQ